MFMELSSNVPDISLVKWDLDYLGGTAVKIASLSPRGRSSNPGDKTKERISNTPI